MWILRAFGKKLDVNKYLKESQLQIDDIFINERIIKYYDIKEKEELVANGFQIILLKRSKKNINEDFNVIKKYLIQNEAKFNLLKDKYEASHVFLDLLLHKKKNIAVRKFYLPTDIMAVMSKLGVDLNISIWYE